MTPRNTTSLIFFDDNKKILLQHRSNDAQVFPSYWWLFGGKIKEGETPKDTVIREIQEEIWYKLSDPQHVLTIQYEDEAQHNSGNKYYFVEKCLDKSHLVLHEGDAMQWFAYDEILKLKIIDHNLEAIKKIYPLMIDTAKKV